MAPLWSLVWKVVNWGTKNAKLLDTWDKLILKEASQAEEAKKLQLQMLLLQRLLRRRMHHLLQWKPKLIRRRRRSCVSSRTGFAAEIADAARAKRKSKDEG